MLLEVENLTKNFGGLAAVNDFVFKLFARKKRSRGVFVFAVGVFYTLLVSFLPDWWGASPLASLLSLAAMTGGGFIYIYKLHAFYLWQ